MSKQEASPFQKLSTALLVPVVVLAVAGLLLLLGQNSVLGGIWHLGVLAAAGEAVIGHMPLLFAISIAVGLGDGSGVAGLAGAVSFFVFSNVLSGVAADLTLGVTAGVLTGLLAGACYNRYHTIRLPDYLAFFAGRRFVPIVSAFYAFILGIVFAVLLGPAQNLLV